MMTMTPNLQNLDLYLIVGYIEVSQNDNVGYPAIILAALGPDWTEWLLGAIWTHYPLSP